MDVRQAEKTDLAQLLDLYTQLHGNLMPRFDAKLELLWHGILQDPNHHVLVGFEEGRAVSSCVLVIVPNLTHNQRPYALIENVITREDCRGRGYAGRLLDYAKTWP